jgi:hypothetical protein
MPQNNESPAVEHVKQSAVATIRHAAEDPTMSGEALNLAIGQQIDRVLAAARQVDASGWPDYHEQAMAFYERFIWPHMRTGVAQSARDEIKQNLAIELAMLDGSIRREIERDQAAPLISQTAEVRADKIMGLYKEFTRYTVGSHARYMDYGDDARIKKAIMLHISEAEQIAASAAATQALINLAEAERIQPPAPITLTAAEAANMIAGFYNPFDEPSQIKAKIAQLIATIQAEARAMGAALGTFDHINQGKCPDPTVNRETRDPDCPACQMMERSYTAGPAAAQPPAGSALETGQIKANRDQFAQSANQQDRFAKVAGDLARAADAAQTLISEIRNSPTFDMTPGGENARRAMRVVKALGSALMDYHDTVTGQTTPTPTTSAAGCLHVHFTFDDLQPQIEKLIAAHIRQLSEEQ